MLVCVWYFVPLENSSHIWRCHLWRAANFDLCSAFMAIQQWGFFSKPHGASVNNGHLWRLVDGLSLPVFTYVCSSEDSNTQPSAANACEVGAITDCVTAATTTTHGFLFCTSHSRIFHSFGDVTIAVEGLLILTYAWHVRPLGSFSVPHLLWHGTSVYDIHLRWPVTLAPNAERLAVELSLHVWTT